MSERKPLTVAEAQAVVLREVPCLGTEEIDISRVLGRVLAADFHANRDLPPFAVSAMDGFAVCSADVTASGACLALAGEIPAGTVPRFALQAGQCARIMTGAPLPQGADAVIRVEDTCLAEDGSISFQTTAAPGKDVRPQGEAMRNGDRVLRAGMTVSPGVVGLLATLKAQRVSVVRQPRVAILSTGDELEAIDAPFDPHRIPESNGHALMAQVQSLGIEPVLLGIAPDEPAALASHLEAGLDPARFDVLLVSGGASVGEHDYVRPVLEALGLVQHFSCVAMRPGHPVNFSSRPGNWVFGLPGNPVSSMVCFEQFVLPALRAMMGHRCLFRAHVTAILDHAMKARAGRTEFIRVRLRRSDAGWHACATGDQGSGILASMAEADGLLVVPAARGGLAAGEMAQVQLFDSLLYEERAAVGDGA